MGKNIYYFILFFCYLLITLLFSNLYYKEYLKDNSSFVFNENISAKRIYEDIEKLEKEKYFIERRIKEQEVNSFPKNLNSIGNKIFLFRDIDWSRNELYKVVIDMDHSFHVIEFINSLSQITYYKVSKDESFKYAFEGENFSYSYFGLDSKFVDYNFLEKDTILIKNIISRGITCNASAYKDNQQLKKIDIQLNRLDDEKEQWNRIDFFYFSITAVFGGGFGDILPNSTIVRKLVIYEYIICGFILLFLANAYFSEKIK